MANQTEIKFFNKLLEYREHKELDPHLYLIELKQIMEECTKATRDDKRMEKILPLLEQVASNISTQSKLLTESKFASGLFAEAGQSIWQRVMNVIKGDSTKQDRPMAGNSPVDPNAPTPPQSPSAPRSRKSNEPPLPMPTPQEMVATTNTIVQANFKTAYQSIKNSINNISKVVNVFGILPGTSNMDDNKELQLHNHASVTLKSNAAELQKNVERLAYGYAALADVYSKMAAKRPQEATQYKQFEDAYTRLAKSLSQRNATMVQNI